MVAALILGKENAIYDWQQEQKEKRLKEKILQINVQNRRWFEDKGSSLNNTL